MKPSLRVLFPFLTLVLGWLWLVPPARAGTILREVFEGIGGVSVSDLTSAPTYPNSPTSTNYLSTFEAPTDVLENYGQRLHGYLVAPETGAYTFWISSDDGGELWLSTDDTPANSRLIANVVGWTSSREWTKEANQQSAPIQLQQGGYYYVSALMKEGGGGDNLAVRWLRPSGVDEGPIPGDYLVPWGVTLEAPWISEQPTNTSVVEGQMARFQVRLGNVGVHAYQWRRNGTAIAGAASPVLDYGPVAMGDQSARFSVRITNVLGSVVSSEAVLTVLPDQVRPTLVSALTLGPSTIRVTFSEPVAAPGATTSGNYQLNNGAVVSTVVFGADTRTVILNTLAPLSFGLTYVLTVNNVTDRAAVPNTILANSQLSFVAIEYAPTDIGASGGSITRLAAGSFDVTGAGGDLGGTTDQFQFSWEPRTGDFDYQTRVQRVVVTDPFLHVGLMARETLAANARFGAVFASSAQLGCFFESRATAGADGTSATVTGGFPANYPEMWLRLRRAGTVLTGYASLDGQNWVQLGTQTLSGLPSQVYFGLAVCSGNAAVTTTAQFRDLGVTVSPTVLSTFLPEREPMGPSSRRTGLAISEIMYHPPPRADGRNLEFVELYNGRSAFEDLSGWRLTGDIDYTFPEGFRLPAGAFVVVAAAPADVMAVAGITNVVGPYTNALANGGGTFRLRNRLNAIRLEVTYADDNGWPASADGGGHSLVLVRPSYGEADPRAWAASDVVGGSPGEVDAVRRNPWRGVVINEFLAHTDLPQLDFVELYNRSGADVALTGCILTDDPETNRYVFPSGTLAAGGYAARNEVDLGFRLDAVGETLYLLSPDRTRVLDAIRFRDQENGVSSGRSPDGSATIRRLAAPTFGAVNAGPRIEDVVINEIMYNPLSGNDADEYVELLNRSGSAVSLSGWRLEDGIAYEFPEGATLASGGYVVVAKDPARLISRYPQLNSNNTLGGFSGSLRNNGDLVALTKPDTVLSTNLLGEVSTNRIHIVVTQVDYRPGGRWGRWTDGGGSSLELKDPESDPRQPSNWADSDETQKGAWTTVTFTGTLDHGNGGYNPDRLHVLALGPGEFLVDDVEVFRTGGANLVSNPGFESGATGWSFFGNHSPSAVQSSGAATGTGCLHVRASGDGDTGINSIRTPLAAGLTSGNTATLRAKVRWLAGWPQMLLRTRGNWIEMAGQMTVPTNLGTPGQANSRAVVNAGPAIYDVTHIPPLPRASQGVVVTCRVNDPDGLTSVRLLYRVDPSATLASVTMMDTGTGGDALAGDGVYTASLGSRAAGNLVAFRVEATDAAGAVTLFPALAPAQECLVRWGDPVPFGTFTHHHLWSTQATESQRGNGLNNTLRDATLVMGNHRVIYNVGFRDKGSPWHGGVGDFVVITPPDDLLLGVTDRVFASTGNGGSEPTGIRSRMAAWLHEQLGVPGLNAHYILFYRNGGLHREISEDLEQPNHNFAESWITEAGDGDLYKIAMWFEFSDDNSGFGATSATLERFLTTGSAYKLARYRWMFQRRSNDGDANNFTNLFNLATAINNTSGGAFTPAAVNGLLEQADIDQWMRVFSGGWIMGDWDMWSYSVGQNMYLYRQPGGRWNLFRWDIDFTFGLGDGSSTRLWSGQDPAINIVYDNPTFRRMLWRSYLDAVDTILLPSRYQPVIDGYWSILVKNRIPGLSAPGSISTYIDQRRSYIQSQLTANDATSFALTSNNGNDFSTSSPTVTLTGRAPFAVATIEINGVPYPLTWTSQQNFTVTVPLPQTSNPLTFVGRDRRGHVVAGATDTITITYTGVPQRVEDHVCLNEVHYNPLEANSSFVEVFNRSTTTPFDLSNFRLEGVGYTFPAGAILQPNSYLVLAKDRNAFALAYGLGIVVFDEFPGSLDNGGERLALIQPGATPDADVLISDVRYDNALPWALNADGLGASLQLVDSAQDEYRVGNWTATATNDVDRVTPGRLNKGRQTLAAFPKVWLNEVQSQNLSGPTDNAGDREPWIELYNADTVSLDLSSYYLTDTYTNLTRWPFPAGTTLGPGQFLTVWADGEPGETAAGSPHTSFRLNATSGSVALVRQQGSPAAPAVMDYLDYVQLAGDRSFGSYPDGEPRGRRLFFYATPGATNNAAFPPVQLTINEFLAVNDTILADLVDGDFEDWFEIHNAGTNSIDLTAYTLTDNLTNANQFEIPPGYVIPPGGFLLVWADNETGQNSPTNADLHVNFQLASGGEQLGLFAPDGAQVDGFAFTAQTNDVSTGRFPDGAAEPLFIMASPSPRQPNVLAGANQPPVLHPIGNRSVAEQTLLTFQATATDPDGGQTRTFSLSPDAPGAASIDPTTGVFNWTPSEADGPGVISFSVRVTDNGVPPRTASERISVTVSEVNRAPTLGAVGAQTLPEGAPWTLALTASDPDLPANALTFSLAPGAPAGLSVDPGTGVLSWTPLEFQGPGTYAASVTVNDGGSPALVASQPLSFTVLEVNNAPVLDFIQPQTTAELAPWSVTIQATDPDSPPSAMTYSYDSAPAGAAVNADTGLITWTPTEAQGPTNAIFVVRATERNAAALSASRTFGVTVTEVNQPPQIVPVSDLAIVEGDTVDFIVGATDPDVPANGLTFSLVSGAPAGASIDAGTGRFLWVSDPDQGAASFTVTVRAADDGPGALADTEAFALTVQPRFHTAINEIMYRPVTTNAGFVELHNPSARTTEDLSGLVLVSGGIRYTFAAGTQLSPGGYLCVAGQPAVFQAAYGAGLPVVGPWTGTLAARDTLQLIRPGTGGLPDVILDTVSYDDRTPWPAGASGGGASLQLVDALRDNDRVGNWAVSSTYAGPRDLVDMTGLWRYYQSGAAEAGWRELVYNDSAWPQGNALLYVEDAALPFAKSTQLALGQTTYYFRARFTVPSVPVGATLALSHVVDDGLVVWLNGAELYRTNMPVDAPTHDLFASVTVGDAALQGPFTLPTALLRPGENVVAVEVHQVNGTSSDVVLGLELDLVGGSVAPYTPGAANSVAAALPEFPPVRLNEVLARNGTGLTDNLGEREPWLELYNPGPSAVSLDGLYLSNDPSNLTRWAFPAGRSVPAGGYLVVFLDGDPAQTTTTELHSSIQIPSLVGAAYGLTMARLQGGQPAVVDWLAADAAGDDVAVGRFPDGDPSTVSLLSVPTPGAANQMDNGLAITSVVLNPQGQPVLSWTAIAGQPYQVVHQSDLGQPGWTLLGTVTATSSVGSYTDTTVSGAAHRYYQIVRP